VRKMPTRFIPKPLVGLRVFICGVRVRVVGILFPFFVS